MTEPARLKPGVAAREEPGLAGPREPEAPAPQALLHRIESALRHEDSQLSAGHQGDIHLIAHQGRQLIVKIAPGRALMGRFQRWSLRREYEAYRRLAGAPGVPSCFGLLDGRYLVLEYIEGPNVRAAELAPTARLRFYDAVFEVIQTMHARGVAHADLKRRDNILVASGERPFLVDFGMAVRYKPGFHPWNHYVFSVGRRLDLNAWIKHKYDRDYASISDRDRPHFRPMLYERIWRAAKRNLRRPWRRLRRRR